GSFPAGTSSAPSPKASSAASRTASRSMPMLFSASASRASPPAALNRASLVRRSSASRPCSWRTRATAPPPRTMASRTCPVPMWWSPRSRASVWAPVTAARASVVKRSNIESFLLPEEAAAAAVLLVDGLPAHAEADRDLLPGPALVAGVGDLEGLQPLGQLAQRADGPQPDRGVPAARLPGERHSIAHAVNVG